MKDTLFLLLLISTIFSSFAQEIPAPFLGNYKGKLQIYAPQLVNTLDMEFEVSKTDTLGSYNYILTYHAEPQSDIRNYKLIAKDSLKSIFTLDENNGIKIPTTYINNTLQSFFKVQHSLLAMKISFKKNEAAFEISVANTTQVDSTQTYDSQFKVEGFPVGTYQVARLKKQ